MKRLLLSLLLLSGTTLLGCGKQTPQPAKTPASILVPTDPWVLTTSDSRAPRGNHGIYLSSGIVGTTWGAFGADANSRCFVAGVYDETENLAPVELFQNPMGAIGTGMAGYRQSLDLRTATLTTELSRTDGSAGTIQVLHPRQKPDLLLIRTTGIARDAIAGQIAATWPFSRASNGVVIHGVSTQNGEARTLFVSLQRQPGPSGRTAADVARRSAEQAATLGYDALLDGHKREWETLWKSDIVIDGDQEAQIMVRKALFDLRQSSVKASGESIAPEGLGGQFYKGHIFWDAEIWMFPALLMQSPDLARNLLDYRFAKLPEARRRARAAGYRGADFPWESARSGKETAPSGFSEGRHVTAGIGWAVLRYWEATADRKWVRERGWPILSGVCDFFVSRAKPTAAGYSLEKVTGPDELEMGVNDNAYTNAMVKRVLTEASVLGKELGMQVPAEWNTIAGKLTLPFDKERNAYLKVRNDKLRKTKQADAELLLWPAELPMDASTATATFDLHRVRPIKNGPAMTSSIHALVAARLGQAQTVESAFRESYRPFIRGPFLLFSEKRSLDRCVFLTGWGGLLDAVGYGMARYDPADPDSSANATTALPRGWTRLAVKGVHARGKRYDIEVTADARRVVESDSETR